MSTLPPQRHDVEKRESEPLDPHLARRLFVAFLIIGVLTLLSAVLLPGANLGIPWYVFALAFVAILAAALAPLFEARPDANEEDDGEATSGPGPCRPRE